MKNKLHKAFTLVELIVVITILAVLATVAFISFQGYTSSSRDSVRLADLKNVEKQLNIHFTQKNFYPQPSDAVSIPTGGNQGTLGKSVTNQIGVSELTDPLTKDYYFYRTSENKRKYQLLGFLENGDSISKNPIQNTFAQNDIPYSKGDKLGIILNSDGKTLPETIDFATQTYDVIFSNKSEENLSDISGEDNFIVLKATDTFSFDKSLVGYWDMESKTSDGKLADLSGNNNHGTIHDANASGLATPVNGAMFFDGVDDYIEVPDSDSLDIRGKEITLISLVETNNIDNIRQRILTKYSNNEISGYAMSIRGKQMINGNKFESFLNLDGNWYTFKFNRELAVNTSYYIANTYNGSSFISYYDNIIFSNQEQNGLLGSTSGNNLKIGASFNNNENFSGEIKQIMIFNRALSQAEINNIYETLQ